MIYIKVFIFILLLSTSCFAEDFYIAQTAAGDETGSSCSNSLAYSFFNTAGNWGAGAGKISAGDTVHLCGTISGSSYGTPALTFQGSGSTGSNIKLTWETGAKLSAARWGSVGAISISSKNYIELDGGTNGIIEATDSGTVKTYQDDGTGIFLSSVDTILIHGLTIRGMYVRPQGNTVDTNRYGSSITILGGTNLSIYSNAMQDGDSGVAYSLGNSASNINIYSNTFRYFNHPISMGAASSCSGKSITGLSIYANSFNDNWYDADGVIETYHADHIILFDESSGINCPFINTSIYNNDFGPPRGTRTTSAIFFTTYTDTTNNTQIYNNLFLQDSTSSWGNGFVSMGGTNTLLANNTMVTTDGVAGIGYSLSGGTGTGYRSYNNLLYHIGEGVDSYYATPWPDDKIFDYNIYHGATTWRGPTGNDNTFASWKAEGANIDPHSAQSEPMLDANWKPTLADTVARGDGINLTSLGITNLNKDKNGISRPTLGAWDIGAYQYSPPPVLLWKQ